MHGFGEACWHVRQYSREPDALLPAGKLSSGKLPPVKKHLGQKRMDDLLLETCTGLETCYFSLTPMPTL